MRPLALCVLGLLVALACKPHYSQAETACLKQAEDIARSRNMQPSNLRFDLIHSQGQINITATPKREPLEGGGFYCMFDERGNLKAIVLYQ